MTVAARFCGKCGAEAAPKHRYCARCGGNLVAASSASAVVTSSILRGGIGKFGLDVKGESHYLDALRRAQRQARRSSGMTLIDVFVRREPSNPYDENAVQVVAVHTGEHLGYLSRGRAKSYQRVLSQCEEAELSVHCEASMYGGTGDAPNIGIWLDLAFPSELLSLLEARKVTR